MYTAYERWWRTMTLQERLKELRGNRTQREIVDEINEHYDKEIRLSNYANWERKANPSIDDLILLADYYNVTLDYLTGRTDYSKPEYKGVEELVGLDDVSIRGLRAIKESSAAQMDVLRFLLRIETKPKTSDEVTERALRPRLSMILEMIAEPVNQNIKELRTLFQLDSANISPEKQRYLVRLIREGERKALSDDLWAILAAWRLYYHKQNK